MSSAISLRPATVADVADLAPRLRSPDADEFAALSALPEISLASSVSKGAIALLIEGHTEALFGCPSSPLIPNSGTPWLASSAIPFRDERRIATLLRASRVLIDHWQLQFPTLWTLADPRNVIHSDWLTWLDFDVKETLQTNSGNPFHLFMRNR